MKPFLTGWQKFENCVIVVGCKISFWCKPWAYWAVASEYRLLSSQAESFWHFVFYRFCCKSASYYTRLFENFIEPVAKIDKDIVSIAQNIKFFRCDCNHSANLWSFLDKKMIYLEEHETLMPTVILCKKIYCSMHESNSG